MLHAGAYIMLEMTRSSYQSEVSVNVQWILWILISAEGWGVGEGSRNKVIHYECDYRIHIGFFVTTYHLLVSFKGGTGQISFLSSTVNARVTAMKTKRNISIKILKKTDHLFE